MIDWFCWLVLLIGLLCMAGSRALHRRIGGPTAVWLIVGAAIALVGAIQLI